LIVGRFRPWIDSLAAVVAQSRSSICCKNTGRIYIILNGILFVLVGKLGFSLILDAKSNPAQDVSPSCEAKVWL
jgi:hypothetical protein